MLAARAVIGRRDLLLGLCQVITLAVVLVAAGGSGDPPTPWQELGVVVLMFGYWTAWCAADLHAQPSRPIPDDVAQRLVHWMLISLGVVVVSHAWNWPLLGMLLGYPAAMALIRYLLVKRPDSIPVSRLASFLVALATLEVAGGRWISSTTTSGAVVAVVAVVLAWLLTNPGVVRLIPARWRETRARGAGSARRS